MRKSKFLKMMVVFGLIFSFTGCGASGGGGKTPSYYPTEEEIAKAAEVISPVLTDTQFYLDGTYFTFPLVVSNFTENGWQVAEDVLAKYDPFPAYSTLDGNVSLIKPGEKNDIEINVSLYNDKQEEVPIGDVYIADIGFERYDKVKMILPGGISWGSTIEDVEAAYGEPDAKAETGSADTFLKMILRYMYEDGSVCAQFTFQSENGEPYKLTGVMLNE